MVRSQVRGVIDWSETRFFDRQWWRRARLLIDEMAAEDNRELRKSQHSQAIALRTAIAAAWDKFDDEAWKKATDATTDCWDDLVSAYRPWNKYDREQREKDEAKRLVGSWESHFGDMNDPEVMRSIQEAADAMMRNFEQEAPELKYTGTVFNARTAAAMPMKGN